MTIGDRLKEERSRLGLSQTDLGAAGGVGKTTQINYEKGTGSPDAKYLSAVAALGIDILYVVTGVSTPHVVDGFTAAENKLVNQFRALPEPDQAAVQRIVGAMWEISAKVKE
ncbi:helix-turn-helix domain-containing protein [Pseudomonas helleri]|uniref:helix-turn-helix domain-containing protein n=1 Tax=Pseudomonas helleri TaxID=1608996 RepID=UPI002433300D|nr:helix-turn-helix transcriptional regulator [Pseudomonas helleri]